MKPTKGWTLLEFILIILIISLTSMVVGTSFRTNEFQEYIFVHKFMDAIYQAKMLQLYAKQDLEIHHTQNTFRFEAPPLPGWEITYDGYLKTDESFPIHIPFRKQDHPFQLETDHYRIVIDANTLMPRLEKKG